MKVLHVGCCAVGEPYKGLAYELSKLGEYREVNSGTESLDDAVLSITRNFTPDLVFLQLQYHNRDVVPNPLSDYVVDILRKKGAWVCNWTGDVRWPIPKWYYEMGAHVNVTLFSNIHDVRVFLKEGLPSKYLQIGFDPTVFNPIGPVSKSADIIFMANNYSGRDDLNFPLSKYRWNVAHALKKEFGDRFALYGNGWPDDICSGSLSGNQYDECAHYRGGKIGINISHYEYESYSSDRWLRILGSGVMGLSHWWPYQETEYKCGDHFDVFHDIPGLIERCHFYLEHDTERKRIAALGSQHVHANFTFENMVNNLLKIYWKNR